MFKAVAFALITFLLIGLVVGQIIMHGQGDTAAISVRYGLLYFLTGCGLPDLFRGHTEYLLPVACEVVLAAIAFWIVRHKLRFK